MTGQRFSPEELPQTLTQLIRYEMKSLPTASIGRIKRLDEETRRAEVETVPDGGTETNVPVASTFANDGVGDLRPLNPEHSDDPVFGIVLYTHHPMDEQLSSHGTTFDEEREHEEENAVFLPAQIWFDSDGVPDHDGDERRIDHPDGGHLELNAETVELVDNIGAGVFIEGSPEPDLPDGPKDFDAEIHDPVEEWGLEWVKENIWPDNTEWPIDEEAEDDSVATRLRHPDGPGVTAVDRGVAVEGNRRVTAGKMTDGERQPLAGKYQHFHTIQHDDGTASLAGPQLSFREFIAWMTADSRQAQLRNAEQYAEEREYARVYLEWLEEEVGREIDPTDPEDWPDPEPMPTVEEHREWFDPEIPIPASVEVEPASAQATVPVPSVIAHNLVDAELLVDAPTATTSAPAPSISTSTHIHATATVPSAPAATTQTPVPSVDAQIVETVTWVDQFDYGQPSDYYANYNSSNAGSFEITSAWGDQSPNSLQSVYTNSSTSRMRSFDPDNDSSWFGNASHSALPYYPQPGDTIHCRFQVNISNDGSWNGTDHIPRFQFGCQSVQNSLDVQITMGNIEAPTLLYDEYSESTIDSGNATNNATIGAGDVLEWVIDWQTDGYITAELVSITNNESLSTLSGQGTSPSAYGVGFRTVNGASTPPRFDAVWVE